MFAARRPARRFSLLLLDEGEYYVQDFVAHCVWPSDVSGNWQDVARLPGQLRLCTRSLFFEADDVRVPIVRLAFAHLEQLEGRGQRGIEAIAQRWTKMKANAEDSPYAFEKGRLTTWRFELAYAPLSEFMPLAQQMLVASRLPPPEQEDFLEGFMRKLEAQLRFDPGHLRSSASEAAVLELSVLCLTPLVRDPGRLVVTGSRLYLQPLHNITGDAAVLSHPLAAVAAVARRRSSLRDIGLEVFLVDPEPQAGVAGPFWGAPSAFFAFRSTEEREQAVAAIMAQTELGTSLPGGKEAAAACGSILEAGGEWLGRVTAAWQRGGLSNFDYLLYCNLAAGRSFNDLTQYPVFPWVLADYTSAQLDLSDPAVFRDLSRPIGALNPTRLAMFRERYLEMATDDHPGPDPPFMYGTHYSCPGYTLFWLVRGAPGHMLRLQNGRFDAPDRLFCGVEDAWKSVTSNPADVKELIPEFYMPGRADILRNAAHLALGRRQNGQPVGDVVLPPWAQASPQKFLEMQRAALESPQVSANLHHWIDLVFGAKQRGQAAEEADNVFRHLTYEGAVDPASISDPMQRAAVETAINEFGQCPRQIFRHPHPPRLVCPPPPAPPAGPAGNWSGGTQTGGQSLSLALVSAIMAAAGGQADTELLEVSPLLRELDVCRKMSQASLVSSAEGAPSEEGVPGLGSTHDSAASPAKGAGSSAGTAPPASPFASRGSALMGRLGAFKDALGEAVSSRDVSAVLGKRTSSAAGADAAPAEAAASASPPAAPSRLSSLAGNLSARAGSLSRWQPFGGSRSSNTASTSAPARDDSREGAAGGSSTLQSSGDAAPGATEKQSAAGSAAALPGRNSGDSELPWKFPGTASTVNVPPTESRNDEAPEHLDQPDDSAAAQQGDATLDTLSAQRHRSLSVTAGKASSRSGRRQGAWGAGLRDRLQPGKQVVAGSEVVNAVALAEVGGVACTYCVGHDGSVRIFDLASGLQLRSSKLDQQPLTSLALLPDRDSSAGMAGPAAMVLCGSYSSRLHVYCPASGIQGGSFQAHSDAVSCLASTPGGSSLITASWDCSVKVWELTEGRQPWSSTLPQPLVEVQDLSGGVWALAVSEDGNTVLTGTEEGAVCALDLRTPGTVRLWEHALCPDYVGGVCFLPGGNHALAACADGALTLLDLRKSGAAVSSVSCGAPLRCCASDGGVALAGCEDGRIVVWDVGQQLGKSPPVGAFTPAGLDGLYTPLCIDPPSSVNALAVAALPRSAHSSDTRLCLVSGQEDGSLHTFWA